MAGWVLELNPFDQPNVQEAKDNTAKALAEGPQDVDAGSLDELLAGLEPPAYVAILAYVPYSEETDAAVARFREKLITEHGVATTFGYGPRYLHSTGQFHKGGPSTGVFVEIVDGAENLQVPGESYSFGTLIRAQADGDLRRCGRTGSPPSVSGRRSSDAARFRRVSGRWAATWSIASTATRTIRSWRSTSAPTPSAPPRATARPAPRRSRIWSPSSKRRAPSG